MDPSAGYPKFCLRFLQPGYDVQNLDRDQRADFAMTLQQRSQLGWNDLARAHRHKQGFEYVPRRQFRGPIPPSFEDRDRFLVFRYSNRLPMAGVRVRDTFHVVWIERRFNDLYDHGGS